MLASEADIMDDAEAKPEHSARVKHKWQSKWDKAFHSKLRSVQSLFGLEALWLFNMRGLLRQ